jgi:hypothetical protein
MSRCTEIYYNIPLLGGNIGNPTASNYHRLQPQHELIKNHFNFYDKPHYFRISIPAFHLLFNWLIITVVQKSLRVKALVLPSQ